MFSSDLGRFLKTYNMISKFWRYHVYGMMAEYSGT
jgi:hypothetical protein